MGKTDECFVSKIIKRYTDGWVIGRKIGKVRVSRIGTSTYDFGERTPPPGDSNMQLSDGYNVPRKKTLKKGQRVGI